MSLHVAQGRKSVKLFLESSFIWSALQNGHIMLDAGQGKLNSWQNHSRPPVMLHKTPLLILLPLNSSTRFPNWSFFGTTPEKRICHDQATVSITCLKLFLVMASFGIAVISSWLSLTPLLESRRLQGLTKPILKQNHWIENTLWGGPVVSFIQFGNHGLKLKTCMESTSVKGAASPCRSHGIGNSLGMHSLIISFSAGDI